MLSGTVPGYRDAGNERRLGDLMSVGHSGHSWASTASGISGSMYLGFHVTGLNPCSTVSRGYGFQLRCLSE